jgi:glycosyltransferase involved in cell wall biosynthesis
MRICILAHAHPALSRGGGETAAWREHRALRASGHDSLLVAAAEEPPADWPALPENEALFAIAGMEEDRLAWADAAAREALLERLLATGAEVFHLHHLWRVGLDVAALLRERAPRARLVLTLHEMLAICAHHGQMVTTRFGTLCQAASPEACAACFPGRAPVHFALRRAAFRRALALFDALVAPSRFLLRRIEEWGFAPREAHVIENTLGEELLAAPRPPLPPGLSARFAFFGRPTPWKGLDVLLRALLAARDEIPHAHLEVHGCDAEETLRVFPGLAGTLAELGGMVSFHGRYGGEEVLSRMRRSGWVCMPSIWWENSPMVIQEAKRAGVPLIVSGIGGMAEKVREGLDGLHVRPGSPRDWAEALIAAAEPETHAAMAASLEDAMGGEDYLAALSAALRLPPPNRASKAGLMRASTPETWR